MCVVQRQVLDCLLPAFIRGTDVRNTNLWRSDVPGCDLRASSLDKGFKEDARPEGASNSCAHAAHAADQFLPGLSRPLTGNDRQQQAIPAGIADAPLSCSGFGRPIGE